MGPHHNPEMTFKDEKSRQQHIFAVFLLFISLNSFEKKKLLILILPVKSAIKKPTIFKFLLLKFCQTSTMTHDRKLKQNIC